MSGEKMTAAAGWCTPSAVVASFLDGASPGELPLEVPVVRSPRGGANWTASTPQRKSEPEPQEPSPDGSAGHWEYGIDVADYDDGDTEPEIYSSGSLYDWSAFRTQAEAVEAFEGRLMKRWVRDADEWQVV